MKSECCNSRPDPFDTARTELGRQTHRFEQAIKAAGVRHSYTKAKHPWTNGYAESFHKTLLCEFYHLAFRRKVYTSLEELQSDLGAFLLQYNFRRSHSGYKLNGMTPAEKFLSGRLCLVLENPKIDMIMNDTERANVST